MNPDAKILSWKSADDDNDLPSDDDQRRRAAGLLLTPEEEKHLDRWVAALNGGLPDTKASTPRTKSTEPVQVAVFEC